ncbi:MAG: hypothetical protein Q4B29_02500 [Candidatus Saccharibacteria bacterium]|nr:hypothetical protein [Candidatus Saccharibacteria bacterium]
MPEKKIYALAIKEYFSDEMASISRELRHYNIVAAIVSAIGLSILAASLLMEGELWPAVLDIVAWVFIWEAVDIIAFRKHELRIRKFRCRAFVNMKIEFI